MKRGSRIPTKSEKYLIEGIWIQMNNDLTLIQRTGYTILDFFSDIGGLQGLLISFISLFLSFWNHNYLENYLVSALFKSKASKKDAKNTLSTPSSNLKEFCYDRILPSNCRKHKKLRIMETAR